MNTAPDETDHEAGRPNLWDRVHDWFARWTAVFTPEVILRDGLSRRFALRCCNWLWPLEAAVRRLIIAAALALDPERLVLASPQQRPHTPEKLPSSPRGAASFRIVSIRGEGVPRPATPAARPAARTERHLPFPSDDLLRLGAPYSRQGRKIVVHHDSPLHRHGRVRPSDPDYIPKSEADYANSSELLFGPPKGRQLPREHDPETRSAFHRRVPIQSEDDEWRRLEKEWERILPAPGIAARITALAGVLNTPESHIRRLARRMAAEPSLAALLRSAPPPLMRKPKHDYFSPQVDEDLTMLAYAATRPPDTS